MKKLINSILLLTLIFGCGFIQPTFILANEPDQPLTIEPRADIIGWRYKTENGRVYKRLFNYSKDEWIGDWILV